MCYISPTWGETPVSDYDQIWLIEFLTVDVVTLEYTCVYNFRVLDLHGVKIWVLPLKWKVTVTTVLRYCAAHEQTLVK
jgi:hypothetical protein